MPLSGLAVEGIALILASHFSALIGHDAGLRMLWRGDAQTNRTAALARHAPSPLFRYNNDTQLSQHG